MSERIHSLAREIFGKSSVEECDLREIKSLAEQYPYFAPVQFLLLEKLKQENSPEYTSQLQKAVLLYHNPVEFQYFISSDKFYTEWPQEPAEPSPSFHEEVSPATEEVQATEDSSMIQEIPEENDLPIEHIVEKESSTEPVSSMEKPVEQINEVLPEPGINESPLKQELNVPGEVKLSIPEQQPSNDLLFEPFHTVDYFASQGIKLSQEEQPKDKFGKQLKSFTEWLKTMKRLPAKDLGNRIDPQHEEKVEHLAEDSVHDPHVVTEAMAEVWLKQGNTQKALEVYNKLSLLNPSKKAYFAAKIEQLKLS